MAQVEDIINGRLNRLDRSNISHPLVKLSLCLLPLSFGGSALLLRTYGYHLSDKVLLIAIVSSLFAQSLDLRASAYRRSLKLILAYLIACALILLSFTTNFISLQDLLHNYLTLEDLMIFGLFGCAARGTFLFNPIDILWLSRLIYCKHLLLVYFTIIFTSYIVQNTVARRVSVALGVAHNKWRLVRRNRSRLESFWISMRLFIQKVLESFEELARLAESILKERGFFSGSFRNTLPMTCTREDLYAVIILLIPIGLFLGGGA